MQTYLSILLAVLIFSRANFGLAQGQTEHIRICMKPDVKTNAKGERVYEEVDKGDKVKGVLYQSARSDYKCKDIKGPNPPVATLNVTLKLHGQSSQTYNQKSYGIEILDKDFKSLDKEQQIQFAGLPRGEKFILTSNYVDRSNMRNPLAYSLAAEMGRGSHGTDGPVDSFGTPYTFAEVTIDGDYRGVYTLSARAERGKERIDIAKVNEEHYQGFDWIGEICTGVKDADYHSKLKTYICFQYPQAKDLAKFKDQKKAELAKQSMIDSIERFETMLTSPGFAHPTTGYASAIDVANFIDFILLEELAKNVDGFRRSVWFRHVDGKIKMGPVWDFDAAFGNLTTYDMSLTSGWLLDFGLGTWYSVGGFEQFPSAFWFRRLIEDPAFASRLKARYFGMRMPGGLLHEDHIDALLKGFNKDIGEAGSRSEKRWAWTRTNPLHSLIFHAIPFDRSYDGNREILASWIKKRLKWMDQNIQEIERRRRL